MGTLGARTSKHKKTAGQRAAAREDYKSKYELALSEFKELTEQQAATAEILRVISSTPTDTQPVFEAIVAAAHRLIAGQRAGLFLRGDSHFELIARAGEVRPDIPEPMRRVPLDREKNFPSRAILDGEIVHITDWEADDVPEFEKTVSKVFGTKSGVIVPLLRKGTGIGALAVVRATTGAFHDKEIALLRSFADQAVIAIENVRLFNETKEALEQQKASAEVLGTISSSIADTKPVFDKILESCERLFEGHYMGIGLVGDDGMVHVAARRGPQAAALHDLSVFPFSKDSGSGTAILERRVVHLPDTLSGKDVPAQTRQNCEKAGLRAVVFAPMFWEEKGIGAIWVARNVAGAFSDKQIALLKTFADQAVIAIQNARLFNETKEALERQTATSEILAVISSSPTDIQPVLNAVAESAARLCEARDAAILLREGSELQLRAHHGPISAAHVVPIMPASPSGLAVLEGRTIHVNDLQAPDTPFTVGRAFALRDDFRTLVVTPLLREGTAIGVILVRRAEALAFADRQIALLKTFADQAVIAIENVRLFNETKEALEQQTGTAEILRVISGSPTDTQPVFDIIADRAVKLCDAEISVVSRFDGQLIHLVASHGVNPKATEIMHRIFPMQPGDETVMARAVRSRGLVHVPDVLADPLYSAREVAATAQYRSSLGVPMMRGDEVIGAIFVGRAKGGLFNDKQVGLIQTFADQAVIAIENVRLFNETTEALERQTATAEILKVISSSPRDLQPVFDTILEKAMLLCEAHLGYLGLYDGEKYEHVAQRGSSPDHAKWIARGPFVPDPRMSIARAMSECKPVQHDDLRNSAGYREGVEPVVKMVEIAGARTLLAVPMVKGERAVGCIVIYRSEVRPFTQRQIDLLSTFASQAVIAIENARLFKELESRTEALTKSVGQLTALGEVGQAISSTLELETVLKTIVSHAVKLTGLDAGAVYEYDERTEEFHLRAAQNLGEEIVEVLRTRPIRKGDGVVGRTAVTREPMQIHDAQDESYQSNLRELVIRTGRRALLAVPLMREDHIIGALTVQRNTPGPFAPEVVELLKTFATQSALAIQNARLFREIAEKGKQLEVASRHKSDFLASMSHELRTPLNAILGFNEMILDQVYGPLSPEVRSPLEEMQSSGKHLLRLINNVLDLAKIEAGRMELALSDYSVQDTVESVRSTLRPIAAEKGLELLTCVPADIPLARGDAGRISQCLLNLAGNSLKFTKVGKVEIGIQLADGRLVYRVTDTGVGIPPDKIGGLFTEFKQTDATIASEYGGTGLGLSITKKFIEMHKGRIWVESELGKGSTFLFEIPLRA